MDTELLQKFYRGECSEEEVREVLDWFSSKANKEALTEQLKASWNEFEDPQEREFPGYNPALVLESIHDRIQEEENEETGERPVIAINRNNYFGLKVASIVALIICASFLWLFFQNADNPGQPESRVALLVKEIPYGEKSMVILEDGSEITLNAGSKLIYPEHFPGDKRQVRLEGEAFFEIARDENRPFTVITGEVLTTVLGTSFNINAAEEDIEVAVASGKVKISHKESSCFLLPGKAVRFKAGDQSLSSVFDFDERRVFSWKEGVLYFSEASYEEVEKKLSKWYGVTIESSGKGNQDWNQEWQYTGSFEGQSLENVLLSIGYVKGFSYSVKGNRVEIIFQNPH